MAVRSLSNHRQTGRFLASNCFNFVCSFLLEIIFVSDYYIFSCKSELRLITTLARGRSIHLGERPVGVCVLAVCM